MIDLLENFRKALNDLLTGIIDMERAKINVIHKNSLRKAADTTKYTQYMYDYIQITHAKIIAYNIANPEKKVSMDDLADGMNATMKTHKSTTSLSNIWNGHTKRHTLPAGEAYFTYGDIENDERPEQTTVSQHL